MTKSVAHFLECPTVVLILRIVKNGVALMKTLLLTCACVALFSSTGLACRGTAEYPQVAVQLSQSDLSAADKEALVKSLQAGEAIHRRGHELDSKELRQESLRILDEIKVKIAR
jgi:hypothetical protein